MRCGARGVLVPLSALNVPDLPHFTFVDTADDFCDELLCPAVRNGVLVSWDGTHLTRTWTMTNSTSVREALMQFFDASQE